MVGVVGRTRVCVGVQRCLTIEPPEPALKLETLSEIAQVRGSCVVVMRREAVVARVYRGVVFYVKDAWVCAALCQQHLAAHGVLEPALKLQTLSEIAQVRAAVWCSTYAVCVVTCARVPVSALWAVNSTFVGAKREQCCGTLCQQHVRHMLSQAGTHMLPCSSVCILVAARAHGCWHLRAHA